MTIQELIEAYGLDIIKFGNRQKVICPFHDDTDPSLVIYSETDSFSCFGCGKGGGLVEFIHYYEGIPKAQARDRLNSVSYLKSHLDRIEGMDKEVDFIDETKYLVAQVVRTYLHEHRTKLPEVLAALAPVDQELVTKKFTFLEGTRVVENLRQQLYNIIERVNSEKSGIIT